MYPYAKRIPVDVDGKPMQSYPPAYPAIQTTASAPPAASSVITFGANTTVIEITALNASLAYKWGSGSVIAAAGATANFDGIVPVNTTKRLVVPISSQGVPSVVGLNAQAGLFNTIAIISTGSVLAAYTEY